MGLLKVGAPYDRRDTPACQAATRPRGTEYAGRSKIFATSIAQSSPLSLFIQSVPDICIYIPK